MDYYSILAKYVEGFVEDLFRSDSAIRSINNAHVANLKKMFKTRELLGTKPFIVNINMEGKPEDISLELLEKGDVYRMEVIGGNHRTEALQQLLRDAETPGWLKNSLKTHPMRVYLGLTHEQKVTLGFWDNLVDECRTKMHFDEVACLFRNELCNVFNNTLDDPVSKVTCSPKDEKSKEWRKRITKLLGCRVSL